MGKKTVISALKHYILCLKKGFLSNRFRVFSRFANDEIPLSSTEITAKPRVRAIMTSVIRPRSSEIYPERVQDRVSGQNQW